MAQAKIYLECFKGNSEGHPLYKEISGNAMKPGACGYFDLNGDWITLVQTDDPEDLKKNGLTPLSGVYFEEAHGHRTIGPRWSKGASGKSMKVDVKAS